jgi:rSAM/selenodomain-associated transferase 2
MKISIVVPVLNEAELILDFLTNLRERAAKAEIIVVDGGSSDGTAEYAVGLCDQLLRTAPGRALQMNAGASRAHGEILWFLHADTRIPETAIADIEDALKDSQMMGGFFRIRVPEQGFIYRLTDSFAHYAGLLMRIRYGDHGFFCRRQTFEKIGGFPEVSIMEDADFFRKLRRAGRVVVIPHPIIVSPRRYESIGPSRLTFAYGLIGLLYFVHAPRRLLHSIHRWGCCRS